MNKLITTIGLVFIGFTAFSQNGNSALIINGRILKDSCGETIMLRGVNHGNIWATDLGIPEFSQIAQTNANCVRICLERKYASAYIGGNPVYEDLRGGQIDTIVQAALDLKLIPIVELHDFTDGSIQHAHVQTNLDSAVLFWTKPSVMAALKKHSRFLILNLANEPEHWEDTDQEFYDACSSAIDGIRTAGLKVPIMIDGMHWGQDETFFTNNGNGANLLANDPEHKLLFSVHTYWETSLVTSTEMTNRFTSIYNSDLPFVIGEFAYDDGNPCTNTINYHLIMDLCQQYQIGYLYWWWGFYNETSNNCLSMTHSGTYAGLADQGLEVAVTYANSIQNTSVKPHLIMYGNCITGINENNKSFKFSVFPNPSDGKFIFEVKSLEGQMGNGVIEIYNVYGESVFQSLILNSQSEINLNLPGGIYFYRVKNKQQNTGIGKIVIQ